MNPLVKMLKNIKEEGIFPTDFEIRNAIEMMKLISITPKQLKRNLKLVPTPLGMVA